MADPVTPALTPEEWAVRLARPGDLADDMWFAADEANIPREGHRHALAALALHGLPYGFTRDDLWALRVALAVWDSPAEPAACDRVQSLLARLAALLPPEGTP